MVVIRGPNVRMPSRCAQDVPLGGLWTPPSPASRCVQEANRGLFEPMYGRFTRGKLVIRDCRERARVGGVRSSRSAGSMPRCSSWVAAVGLIDSIIGPPPR